MLSYHKLVKLQEQGVIECSKKQIQSASIDVTLGDVVLVESPFSSVIDVTRDNPQHMNEVTLRDSGYMLRPGGIMLATINEKMNLPNNIAAKFTSKSSVGRCFLNHMHSDHADPGYTGYLTLELVNMNQQHSIRIIPGMPIGQMLFTEVEPVPDHILYSKIGQYNNNSTVPEQSKGAR